MLGNIQITEANIMSIRTNLIVADSRSVRILIERGNEPGDGVRFFDAGGQRLHSTAFLPSSA